MSVADRRARLEDDAAGHEHAASALERMRRVNPEADPCRYLPDVDPARIPRHVAIIMDGNGRWAEERGFPRIFGHRNGAIAVREVVQQAGRLGIEYVTLFSFSSENWRRPKEEVDALMQLCVAYCQGEQQALRDRNIRVRVIGDRQGLPGDVAKALDELETATGVCTGPTLCLAINYGGRAEIVQAAKMLARQAASGELDPEHIDEAMFSSRLYTAGMPDPDLLIRTGGQMRVSNYLLWQISYAELYVSDLYWPDFDAEALNEAVRDFALRDRRFGGLKA
ncbi:MAG: isoprenyl transferase [Phycisphaerales bacterium]